MIVLAVRWYLRFGLSYRDVEELLTERGIEVDHVTVYRWVQRFTPLLADAAGPCRHAVGDRWYVDETYVKVAGEWRYVYRAIDQYGQIIDVYVSARRDTRVARRFFAAALRAHGEPTEVVTDRPGRSSPSLMSSRVHAEPATRPLRTRDRRPPAPARRDRVHRTRPNHLKGPRPHRVSRHGPVRLNATAPPPATRPVPSEAGRCRVTLVELRGNAPQRLRRH
jgi:transposase-like protein